MDEEVETGYPLHWPVHWKRTKNPQWARFRTTLARARDEILNELRLMGAKRPVISSDLQLRRDGLPYSNRNQPNDRGIAVYFTLFGKQQCIPCDKWTTIQDNLQAIAKTVAALRGLERWGAKDMVEAAFRGFAALPAPDQVMNIGPQYFKDCSNKEEAKQLFRKLCKEMHPDFGGDDHIFIEMKKQYDLIKDDKAEEYY